MAENLSDEEIMGLKEMFRSLDTDNSGTITLEELRSGLPKLGTKISESEIKQLMEAVCSSSISICFVVFLLMHNFLTVILFFLLSITFSIPESHLPLGKLKATVMDCIGHLTPHCFPVFK